MDDKYPVRHEQAASQILDGQAMVVLVDAGRVNLLNQVGTRIWELIDGKRTVRQIAETLVAEFQVTPQVALEDTRTFIANLIERQAVELRAEPA